VLGRLRRSGGSDSDAMYARACQYSNETDPPDLDAARGWYERAANAGHVDAMYSLGMLHEASTPPVLDTVASIYERDGDILESAGRG
jgi:TPR repeat protein